ncbi:phage protein [Photobacterium aphoticum]|uniref:Phage protein n=1 Tax=Photobacterium aphoticum TaxID=754436 RepID=A0A090R0B8_9GAMM|nr:phage protein [Photobacterium aphoticum]
MAKGETKTPKGTKTDTKHHPQVTKGDSVIPGQMEGSERQLETKNPESLTSTPAKVQGEDPVAAKLGGVTKELAALLKATENLAHVDPGQVVNSVTNNTNTVAAGDANSHVANNSSSTNNQVSRISGDKSVSIGGTESTSNQLGSQPSKAKPAKQEASPFEGYWHDEKGQLRKSNGQYASKAEKEAYSSSQDAKDRNAKEKELSLIGKLVGYAKDGATLVSENGGKAEEATAVAAGGSYFYAAKELFDLGRDTVEQFGNIKESVSSKVESFRESHSGKDGDKESQGSEVKVGDQINKIEVGTKEDQASQKPAALHKRMAKMLGFPVPVGKSANPGHGQQKAQQPKKPRGTSIESQTYEVLREQSSEQQQYQATMLKEADDMIKAIKGIDTPANSGLAGSVMDSIGDLFEGKRGGRRKTLREKLSRKPKPSSVIEAASDIADSKGKNPSFRVKGGKPSMLSRIGGSLKASGGAGALAAVFAGYDKYTEMQQRTDLSTTQKGAQVASTAVGAGGGAMAGGAAGAALGSIIFPGVGTAIGGAIGAVLGGTAGQNVGDTIGQSLSNFIGSDKTITQVIGNAWTTAVESTAATASSAVDSIKGWFGFGDDDETKPATERLQPGSTESTMAAVKSQLALGKTFDQGPDVTKGMQHTYSGGTNRGSYTNPAMVRQLLHQHRPFQQPTTR